MLSPNHNYDAGRLAELFRRAFVGCQVRPGETVAVVDGPHTPPGYADACRVAADVLGAKSFGVSLPSVSRPFTAVPAGGEIYGATGLSDLRPAVEALKRCDLVVDLVVLLHSSEQEEILEAGARMLMITEPPEILERMFPTEDLRRRVERSIELLGAASTIAIRSEAGTDITMGLGQFGSGGGWGFTTGPGTHAHWPAGLAARYPDDGTASGRWVIDRGDIIFPFKTYVRDPIVIDVEGGFIRSIEGEGSDAALYRDYLESWGDPEGFAMSHIGWGLNERALWSALTTMDRAATQGMDGRCYAGNVLFSTGPNNEAGGDRFTLAHSDVPLRACSLWLDDVQILDAGRFVPDDLAIEPAHFRLGSVGHDVRSALGPIGWVLIYVDDLPTIREFYEGVLGLTLRDSCEHFANYYTGGCTLELMCRPDNGPTEPSTRRGWERNRMHVSFKVEDIERTVAELEARGLVTRHGIAATVQQPGSTSSGKLAQFEDPEGNLLEICDERMIP